MNEGKFCQYGGLPFLVCGQCFKETENEVFTRMREEEGFSYGKSRGNSGICDWGYINIEKKLLAFAIPGVGRQVVGGHAITIDEFYTVYEIYKKCREMGDMAEYDETLEKIFKKYEGKEKFVFYNKRFDYDR